LVADGSRTGAFIIRLKRHDYLLLHGVSLSLLKIKERTEQAEQAEQTEQTEQTGRELKVGLLETHLKNTADQCHATLTAQRSSIYSQLHSTA
jgi:hypothetical protein